MSWYSKYIIVVSLVGIIGIPIFIIDANDIAWSSNKESYWGLISLFAIIVTVFVNNKSKQKANQHKQ